MTARQATRKHPEVLVVLLASAALAWWVAVERMSGMDAEVPGFVVPGSGAMRAMKAMG